MNRTLTASLLAEFRALRAHFSALDNQKSRKELIRKTCANVSADFDKQAAANTMNIINHYLAADIVDINWLIEYLSSNEDLDYQTLLREEKEGFDREFGTTTSSILRQFELPDEVSLYRVQTSGRCHPSPVASVKMALAQLKQYDVQYEEFVLIDVGAGLGRNLLLAAEYPFRKVIGIEHSRYLTSQAEENIKKYREKRNIPDCIDLYCKDALEYSFPHENMVMYFWRPFGDDDLAARFFNKLQSFVATTSCTVVLLFLGLVYPAVKNSNYWGVVDIFFTPDLMNSNGDYFPVSVFSNIK